MRTQTPTPPFGTVDIELARYGTPQHETAVEANNSPYGPPQHETELEDPEWLISIAAKAFSVDAPSPGGSPETETEQEPKAKKREPTVLRQ